MDLILYFVRKHEESEAEFVHQPSTWQQKGALETSTHMHALFVFPLLHNADSDLLMFQRIRWILLFLLQIGTFLGVAHVHTTCQRINNDAAI